MHKIRRSKLVLFCCFLAISLCIPPISSTPVVVPVLQPALAFLSQAVTAVSYFIVNMATKDTNSVALDALQASFVPKIEPVVQSVAEQASVPQYIAPAVESSVVTSVAHTAPLIKNTAITVNSTAQDTEMVVKTVIDTIVHKQPLKIIITPHSKSFREQLLAEPIYQESPVYNKVQTPGTVSYNHVDGGYLKLSVQPKEQNLGTRVHEQGRDAYIKHLFLMSTDSTYVHDWQVTCNNIISNAWELANPNTTERLRAYFTLNALKVRYPLQESFDNFIRHINLDVTNESGELHTAHFKPYLQERLADIVYRISNRSDQAFLRHERLIDKGADGLVTRTLHGVQHWWSSGRMSEQILNNPFNQKIITMLDASAQLDKTVVTQIAKEFPRNEIIQKVYQEFSIDYQHEQDRIYDQLYTPEGIARIYQTDPLWTRLAHQEKQVIAHDEKKLTQWQTDLAVRHHIKTTVQHAWQIPDSAPAMVHQTLYDLIQDGTILTNPVALTDFITARCQTASAAEYQELTKAFFLPNGILKDFAHYSAAQLTEMPAAINMPEQRELRKAFNHALYWIDSQHVHADIAHKIMTYCQQALAAKAVDPEHSAAYAILAQWLDNAVSSSTITQASLVLDVTQLSESDAKNKIVAYNAALLSRLHQLQSAENVDYSRISKVHDTFATLQRIHTNLGFNDITTRAASDALTALLKDDKEIKIVAKAVAADIDTAVDMPMPSPQLPDESEEDEEEEQQQKVEKNQQDKQKAERITNSSTAEEIVDALESLLDELAQGIKWNPARLIRSIKLHKHIPGAMGTNGPIRRLVTYVKQQSANKLVIKGPTAINNVIDIKGPIWELEKALQLTELEETIIAFDKEYAAEILGKIVTREFDIITEKALIECKNINWATRIGSSAEKLQNQFLEQQQVAQAHGKIFEIHSKGPIPLAWQQWFTEHTMKYFEGLG